jgi:peptidoglycan/xylan/chitin deacetylase (PgdA/CDA1 family)
MISEHRPNTRFNKLRVPPARFEAQLRTLARRGANFVFAGDLVRGVPLPDRPVCLTFDDGYADNLLAADPILARYNARATLFLVGDLDNTEGWSSKKKAHHSDDELAHEPKLSDEQVRALLATGRWELGGHTTTHPHLPSIPDDAARREIGESRASFRDRFGVDAPTFAYPFGIYEPRHVDMIRAAGFRGAFTTEPAIGAYPYADSYSIPRIKVSGKDGRIAFLLRLRGGKRGLNS